MIKLEIKLTNRRLTIYPEGNCWIVDYYDPEWGRIYLSRDYENKKEMIKDIKEQIQQEIQKLQKSVEELNKL